LLETRRIRNNDSPEVAAKILFADHPHGRGSGWIVEYLDGMPGITLEKQRTATGDEYVHQRQKTIEKFSIGAGSRCEINAADLAPERIEIHRSGRGSTAACVKAAHQPTMLIVAVSVPTVVLVRILPPLVAMFRMSPVGGLGPRLQMKLMAIPVGRSLVFSGSQAKNISYSTDHRQ
jgi:hypothetical protein